ncbi:VQ motif-containing protein 1-like [Rhododendron vialii]|uniref:VQ motif-containing protein 1-like n=1 Tax=Rhododendron vialii TaxID=182163 RepID=UPI00265DDD7D|nr:VQ motif-containing protein 1-like [Rhododendron vialii]
MSRGNVSGLVKVVYIETKYVETDATSFKSVVQRLTGKDSKVGVEQTTSGLGAERRVANLSRLASFKEFDRLLMELPPLDELYRLCTG